MAGSSVIGALRVNLGLDSAQFQTGLKLAQGDLGRFGKLSIASLAGVAAATAGVAAGFAVLGKRAIDSADDISKAAQKVGVTTEALSRLKFAGDFADVSLEQLSGGLQRLAKNMADAAGGTGGAAERAFKALGISVTDASGQLRSADQVFIDIADRFGRLEDGSTKTALSMQLLGKSGTDLIPLLNEGAGGLKRYADEADQLGLTISGKTGKAAEEFNDTLTMLGRVVDGVAMQVATAALPALQGLVGTLASPQFAQAATSIGTVMVSAFNGITQAIIGTTNAATALFEHFERNAGAAGGLTDDELNFRIKSSRDILGNSSSEKGTEGYRNLEARLAEAEAELARRKYQDPVGKAPSFSDLSGFGFKEAPEIKLPTFGDMGGGDGAAALQARLDALRQSLMTEEQLEMDSYLKRLEEIKKFYADGAIARGEYDTLLETAQEQHSDRMNEIARQQVEEEARVREALVGDAASIFGSLGRLAESMGEKNLGIAIAKAFGVAEAVVNTAQGITKALAQGGVLGFTGAAAVAAAGAAQISTILSAQKGSTSKPSVKGGDVGSAAAAIAAPQQGGLTLQINGSPDDRAKLSDVASLIKEINDYYSTQGKEIAVVYKGA
jgi:hypothetical protein